MDSYNNIISVKFAQAEHPKFEEKKGSLNYIEFGYNNLYPNYLMDLYNESPKHGAIIKGKANYVFGKGFEDVEQKANTAGDTWNSIVKKCILDDELYAGYYLQIIYNLLGNIKDVFHIEYHKVRTNKDQSKFYVKNDWASSNFKEKVREYPAFSNKYDKKTPACILFIKQYNPKSDIYPLPNYFHGLNYIECDIQISRWILGNAKDGFAAGKLIQFFNGDPVEEQKGQIEKGLKKKFSGSEGDRYTIVFSKSGETPVQISDLGNTMLTKEDFTPVNLLVQTEIFACHQVTSPMLFGIKTEGQLGGRSEIRDAYEIFNNTYVNERQQAHEETFNFLFNLTGITGEHLITPVEPLGFSLDDAMLLKVMPREYFMDKLAVDPKYYLLPPVEGTPGTMAPAPIVDATGQPVAAGNDNIKNLTGRQHQQVMRIVRQFLSGKMTKDQAGLMLKSGFSFTDEDVNTFLGVDNDPATFSSQEEIDFTLLEQFSKVGEDAGTFEVLTRKPARVAEYFADVKELTELEANVLNLIKKDKRMTANVIATTLQIDTAVVNKVMTGLVEAGILIEKATKVGEDTVIEREASGSKTGGEKPTTTEILIRYEYAWRSIVPPNERNTAAHPSRDFCIKMMGFNRLYSRSDIESISMQLGYSVWDRVGGWWTMPDGQASPQCRHEWNALTVIRKK